MLSWGWVLPSMQYWFSLLVCNLYYNHWQKSWDTFAFLAHFPLHTVPAPPLTPQTTLDASTQNFVRVLTLYRVAGVRSARKLRKGCTVLWGNQEITEQYEYCITVPLGLLSMIVGLISVAIISPVDVPLLQGKSINRPECLTLPSRFHMGSLWNQYIPQLWYQLTQSS